MVHVCDKRYHIYNRFRHFGAEIKKSWNYPLDPVFSDLSGTRYSPSLFAALCDDVN